MVKKERNVFLLTKLMLQYNCCKGFLRLWKKRIYFFGNIPVKLCVNCPMILMKTLEIEHNWNASKKYWQNNQRITTCNIKVYYNKMTMNIKLTRIGLTNIILYGMIRMCMCHQHVKNNIYNVNFFQVDCTFLECDTVEICFQRISEKSFSVFSFMLWMEKNPFFFFSEINGFSTWP